MLHSEIKEDGEMANELQQRWQAYRPSKAALFWSCVGCVVVALIIGFTWGGWVTGGTATKMAERSAREARADLAATICVDRFLEASDARAQLASLKETSSWQRDDFIEKGGWVALPGLDQPVTSAAAVCAERLAAMDLPPTGQAAENTKSGTESSKSGAAVQ
jgi:hypothetical protein